MGNPFFKKNRRVSAPAKAPEVKAKYVPFFNIYSESLHILLGVKDMRSVRIKIKNIGCPIHGTGKDSYIITEEVIEALRSKSRPEASTYTPKGKYHI